MIFATQTSRGRRVEKQESLICGVDEAGRGPLAGPVVAAAVILDKGRPISGLTDSKRLSHARRKQLAEKIRQDALAWKVAEASVAEIEALNILQATLLAMQRAITALGVQPDQVLVDGNRCPNLPLPASNIRSIVGGDASEPAISAASILAKTARDAYMLELHQLYPNYAFLAHKGYPTRQHLALLAQYGPCPEHRRSFAPVAALLSSL